MTSLVRLDDLDDDALAAAYAPLATPWLRLNFVATVDGAATGADGLSGSINNPADNRVFGALRKLADVIIAGAGTVRAEGYRPNDKPMVVVSRSGDVPASLQEGSLDQVYVATVASAPGLTAARVLLGDRVLVLGDSVVDLSVLRSELVARGFADLLCEGGPKLAWSMIAAGVVDELCCTVVPHLVAGAGPRILTGPAIDAPLELAGLLESEGTLLARWRISS